MMETRGYETGSEVLRVGPFTTVRGRRRRDGLPVLLKTPAQRPAAERVTAALEHEWRLLRTLAVPGAPEALEFFAIPGGACLALRDRGCNPLPQGTAAPSELPRIVRIALGLCRILAELHHRGIVHGGIRPGSLLLGPDGAGVELLDFSTALPVAERCGSPALPPDPLYMAPEQSGRVDREIDHRTDLYLLGVTLYELLTGAPPFRAADPLELVHSHLARVPVPPDLVAPAIPSQLSRIVLRLLSKAAEDRYQSATGLAFDLAVCEREWSETGRVAPFELGRADVSERFLIPQRLYGRDLEIAALRSAFEEVCSGRTALFLVSGYSGIGKSSLIAELSRAIAGAQEAPHDRPAPAAQFVSGKFDQVVRNLPYGALIEAFRGFLQQLLTLSEDRLAPWRTRFATALGSNGGVLAEVLPEIEFLLGPQDTPPALDPAEAQNRFRYVFQSFVEAAAGPEHPLVVFLDDLQWVDPATLDLLHALLTATNISHLLVVGAYRANEVDPDHPLPAAVERLQACGAALHQLSLGSLALPEINRLLGDTLHASAEEVEPLGRLILGKTDGNPFFVIQFLTTLQQDGLVQFDRTRGTWAFRMEAIAAAGLTDNVVELMTQKIRRLSREAQSVMTLAACVGSRFDWQTCLAVTPMSAEAAAAGLAEALAAGLVRRAPTRQDAADAGRDAATYTFLHDRVQQAAYTLLPEEDRRQLHLSVGRLLLAQAGPDVTDERLFEIVNHLHVGRDLIADPSERLEVAHLSLAAGRKAKTSAAYQAAAAYLTEGIALAADLAWASHYELLFQLHLEAAECEYLAGHFVRAEQHFALLLHRAATAADAAQVHALRTVLYENLSRYDEAVASARAGLAIFGIHLPETAVDAEARLEEEIAAIDRLLAGRAIRDLVELPDMADAAVRLVMRILTTMWAPAYLSGDESLTRLISAKMVRLSLEHGSTEDTAYGCVTHAITIGPVRRDFAAAYEWGELALALNHRYDDRRRRAKIHQQFHAHVNLWRRPFETCIPHAREARRSGLEAGDFTYAGYGAVTETWPALLVNRNLEGFVAEHSPTLALLERIRMSDFHAALTVMLQWARALQGRTRSPLSLSDHRFDEEAFVRTYRERAPFFLTFSCAARLHIAVLLERYDEAVAAADEAAKVAATGTIWPVLVDFWGALALAGHLRQKGTPPAAAELAQLDIAQRSLAELSAHCPENFRVFELLVRSELTRLRGDDAGAIAHAEEALAYARGTDHVQHEALASELAARLHLAAGHTAAGAALIRAAHQCYVAWGATTKVRHIEATHGGLLEAAAADAANPAPPPSHAIASLDVETVVRVARAVAGEIELPDLLRRFMKLAMENAGAGRGMFLQERDGELVPVAEATADSDLVRLDPPVRWEDGRTVAGAIVRFVRRTGQDVVLADAMRDERFGTDEYIRRAGVKSVLCVPVVHQGRPAGLLYLENNLTAGAFTPARAELMRILAAQAAISLENARLYEAMKAEVARRTAAEESLRDALAELEALKNRLEAENVYLQEEIRTTHNFNEIVGNSPPLLQALRKVEAVAPTESTVLILGETGSGKELFARAVHSRSRRSGRPLVKVNCGAIAPGLVESELFGHVKGAFTGAIDKRVGRFELAHGGTILLDEIGELPLEAQVKLLRVLQEQELEPVGSSRTVHVDVRVIAATNRDLEEAVRQGRFRADLLYRLNVFPIHVPPLRERKSDIPLLVGLFVTSLARKLGKPIQGFSTRSMEQLMAYSWPGNVRELQNIVERVAILARTPVLELDAAFPSGAPSAPGPTFRVDDTLDNVQREHILAVLKMTGGVVEGARGAATILGIHPNTLRSRMKKLGISGLPRA